MKVGIFDFNQPIDTCIEQGIFHAHARDEFVGNEDSPVGHTVIGINPKHQMIDAIATVVGSDSNWSFRTEHVTILKLELVRLANPIPLERAIFSGLAGQIAHYTQEVLLVPEALGTNLFQLIQSSGQAEGFAAKAAAATQRLAEIRAMLTRDDLTDSAKIASILAKDGLGQFGDAVWARDLEQPFDLEEVMGDEQRIVHIRPWEVSTDAQRLDPDNGLLLPSEIADAFENGYVTFDLEGRIVVSGYMMRKLWNLEGSTRDFCAPLEMNRSRHGYMQYHREHIYEGWLHTI